MNIQYKDFIGLYNDVYPEGYCEHLISEFERLVENGAGSNRQISEKAYRHHKDDLHLGLNIKVHQVLNFERKDTVDIFFDGLQKCFEDYTERFSILKNDHIRASSMKMQRTSPGGGYHIWHSEQAGGINAYRVIVYMLYLNTLNSEECGETEFLYQQLRINPEKNTMVLWPASYTHAHRGNVVYGEKNKYIVTGWFHYD